LHFQTAMQQEVDQRRSSRLGVSFGPVCGTAMEKTSTSATPRSSTAVLEQSPNRHPLSMPNTSADGGGREPVLAVSPLRDTTSASVC
jgi:hypothetical protein